MTLDLDALSAPSAETPAATPLPAAAPATIFEDPDGTSTPFSERQERIEKKLNGVLYFLRLQRAARRRRAACAFLALAAGLSAVGYSYWPQLRDADWGAVRDFSARAGAAYRDRALSDFLASELGSTPLGRVVSAWSSGPSAALPSAVAAPAPALAAPSASSGSSAPAARPRPRPQAPQLP